MEAIRRKLEKLRMRREARKQLEKQQPRPYSTAWSLAAAAASSSNNGRRRPPAAEEGDGTFLPPKPEIVTA